MKLEKIPTIEFYCDVQDDSIIYAEFTVPGEYDDEPDRERFVKINHPSLESYLRQMVIPKLSRKTKESAIIQNVKDAVALWGNPDKVSPKVRTAGKLTNGLLEYDLRNDDAQYVKVTSSGWQISEQHQYKFLRSTHGLPQVLPKPPTKSLLTLLCPYVNCDKKSLILFAVWLVQTFCEGSHSILLVMAAKGCGKSTLSKIVRQIIDPSKLSAAAMPKKQDDLTVLLANTYVAVFDNTDEVGKDVSNLLCSAVTGATAVKREYYTTQDLCVLTLHNALVINGISVLPGESDLADRCLLLNLNPISSTERRTDLDIQKRFQVDLPEILGAIFDTIARAMTTIHTIAPTELPRMADSYVEMAAIAVALGISEKRFKTIYDTNLAAIDKARGDIAIVEAVREYMTSGLVPSKKLRGTITEVYQKISKNYSGRKQDLPRSASHFSRKLSAEHSALLAAGFIVNIDPTHADATRIEIIKK